jgi:hypothetical protein
VFASRGWMRVALVCNLLGAILLFLSFQATSSNFRLVTDKSGNSALCVRDRVLVQAGVNGGMRIGIKGCPSFDNAKPVAVVTIELPWFAYCGFALTLIGFTLQYFALPGPTSLAAMREELRIAKKMAKLSKPSNTMS